MDGVRTRRQAQDEQQVLRPEKSNGNGSVRHDAVEPADEKENIFLFVPNLIGYSRIVLAGLSLYYMPLHPRTCSGLYSFSCFLDALDGYSARYFKQSTKFGAVLDMITDRCTTSCLLVFLSTAWPRWAIIFQGLISLDLASHYMHMYATLAMGSDGQSHKKVEKSRSRILNLYYSNNTVLFYCCAFNELFFLSLYLLCFSSPLISPTLAQPAAGLSGSVTPTSHLFASPWSAASLELARANKMDSFWPWTMAIVSAPIMAIKQAINVVQLVKAARWLAEGDRKARALQRGKKS